MFSRTVDIPKDTKNRRNHLEKDPKNKEKLVRSSRLISLSVVDVTNGQPI